MKNQLYGVLFISVFIASACSPSTKDEVKEKTADSALVISDNSSSKSNQNFKSAAELSLQGIIFTISATNNQPTNSIRQKD